ncbi:MAG TPA: iron ABC transporter permease [Roseiflexaceae bacterium]|nr:iron ABC transporter permease [Roseiflexaceae bacterium]HMP40558.1 iron ABC transporter permease [Roseiflexaceae bacterium]
MQTLQKQPHPVRRTAVAARGWRLPRHRGGVIIAVLLLGIVTLLSIVIGSVAIPPEIAFKILLSHIPGIAIIPDWPASFERILLDIRLPRVALVAITGATLACSGAAYQGLFRNPLADPYLIGVASGAGLGAILAAAIRTTTPDVPLLIIPFGAFIGAVATVATVYTLGRIGGVTPITTLLLAGVAIGTLTSAASTFILLRLSSQTARILAFLLGGYATGGWEPVLTVVPFALVGFVTLVVCARPLNLILFDEFQARQLGIDVERLKLLVIIAATLMTAAAVAFSGLVGFAGLIVPHTIRLLVGADHRRLLPLAALGGATFLLLADLLARTLIAPAELPLGVVTAAVGAPFFLYLLRRAKGASFF